MKFISFGAAVLLAVAVLFNYPKLNILTGYSAKNTNSAVFLAHRDFAFVDSTDNRFFPVELAKDRVEMTSKTTFSSVWGMMKRKAIFRPGTGSVLLPRNFDESKISYLQPSRHYQSTDTLPFPYGNVIKDTLFPEINYTNLNDGVERIFAPDFKTRAVVVVYKNRIVAEKYAEGFDENSLILGWSMTKSITATLYGIMQSRGMLSVDEKTLLAEWQPDDRKEITLHQLLQMNSGLEWDENYFTLSDVTKMLYLETDMSEPQRRKPLLHPPGTHWKYSSGVTNLLSGYLKNYFENDQAYLNFWYSALIDKIGMHSMVIETDLANNFVGSSYAWATPRDWSKFGLLYLNRGWWNGEQVFDPSWADYVATPNGTSKGLYGAHFWLNAGGVYPNVPRDLFSCNGFQGQHVFIIPSKEAVVVRFGLKNLSDKEIDEFLSSVLDAVQQKDN